MGFYKQPRLNPMHYDLIPYLIYMKAHSTSAPSAASPTDKSPTRSPAAAPSSSSSSSPSGGSSEPASAPELSPTRASSSASSVGKMLDVVFVHEDGLSPFPSTNFTCEHFYSPQKIVVSLNISTTPKRAARKGGVG